MRKQLQGTPLDGRERKKWNNKMENWLKNKKNIILDVSDIRELLENDSIINGLTIAKPEKKELFFDQVLEIISPFIYNSYNFIKLKDHKKLLKEQTEKYSEQIKELILNNSELESKYIKLFKKQKKIITTTNIFRLLIRKILIKLRIYKYYVNK